MDSIIVIAGAFIAAAIIYILFQKYSTKTEPKSKEQKKEEIVSEYREILESELNSISSTKEKIDKKTQLLQKFSQELSMNIFFDKDDIREVISNLAKI